VATGVAVPTRHRMDYGLAAALRRGCGWAAVPDSCCGVPWEAAERHRALVPPVEEAAVVDMKKHAATHRPRSATVDLNSDAGVEADTHSAHIEAVAAEERCMAVP
jgi:hypothetical protein